MRERQIRNFLATLLLSQGVPMLCGGDEFSRSQRGNNNAYCQDNELTWYDWALDSSRMRLMEFTRKLVKLRRTHANLHRRKFFQDRTIRNSVERDVAWYGADGHEMTEAEWTAEWTRSMGLMLNGKTLQVSDENGDSMQDDSFLILVNAFHEGVEFTLPPAPNGSPWSQVMDTENIDDPFQSVKVGEKAIVGGRSMKVFSDNKEAIQMLNDPTEPKPSESTNPEVP
jgi:glycogen operon protein